MATKLRNPFVTKGYSGPEYFCDREKETADIVQFMTNGNNISLISPRRVGKTDLLHHCFSQREIKDAYHTIIIDIYNTNSLRDFVNVFGIAILNELRTKGRAVWETELTLDEIFRYINTADKPCFVAIDEFQQITRYGKDEAWKVEATLRTYIQQCTNGTFIFSGSHRHLMTEMFLSPSRPFYQQTTLMTLKPIPTEKYHAFASAKFEDAGKHLADDVVEKLFARFDSVTAYIQKVMNVLYDATPVGGTCTADMIDDALDRVLDMASDAYASLLYQMPQKQRDVLLAIAKEGKAQNISGGAFIRKHHLSSASSVVSAVKGLLEKDFITEERGVYWVYDLFFVEWLRREGY